MKILQGIDLVKVDRMERTVRRSGKVFLDRTFSREEQAYCRSKRHCHEHYAARFAAKQALLKAVRQPPATWRRLSGIEVRRLPTGKPYLELSDEARRRCRVSAGTQIELSLAHEREYAIATVVVVVPSKK
ncbi:MAG: holo-ACP synthase [Candidatus Omnitrophica bacterium]|nr:holo-ACP synthase [Candidatus Omnitrophota bacterium]